MGLLAAFLGGIGALCAIMGIVIAAEAIEPPLSDEFTWTFWFILSAILLLGSIASSLGKGEGPD